MKRSAVAAALAALGLAVSAQPSFASVVKIGASRLIVQPCEGTNCVDPGENSNIAVTQSGSQLTVSESGTGATLTAGGGGCANQSPTSVTCPANGVTSIFADLGNGNDTFTSETVNLPASIQGGPGDDVLTGGPAIDTLTGGAGVDRRSSFSLARS